ncbi:MAG: hypothetical protein ACOC16_01025 [Nanoarchaeota archaeon]
MKLDEYEIEYKVFAKSYSLSKDELDEFVEVNFYDLKDMKKLWKIR